MNIYTRNFDISYKKGKIERISADFCRQTRKITLDDIQNSETGCWAYIKLFGTHNDNNEYNFPSETPFKIPNNIYELRFVQKGECIAFKFKIPGREPLFFIKER